MKTLYEITIRIPVDPEDFSTMERVSAVHQAINDGIAELSPDMGTMADIDISKPKFVRRRDPAPPLPESAASEGAGADQGSPAQAAPASDPLEIPEMLLRAPR